VADAGFFKEGVHILIFYLVFKGGFRVTYRPPWICPILGLIIVGAIRVVFI